MNIFTCTYTKGEDTLNGSIGSTIPVHLGKQQLAPGMRAFGHNTTFRIGKLKRQMALIRGGLQSDISLSYQIVVLITRDSLSTQFMAC